MRRRDPVTSGRGKLWGNILLMLFAEVESRDCTVKRLLVPSMTSFRGKVRDLLVVDSKKRTWLWNARVVTRSSLVAAEGSNGAKACILFSDGGKSANVRLLRKGRPWSREEMEKTRKWLGL